MTTTASALAPAGVSPSLAGSSRGMGARMIPAFAAAGADVAIM